MATLKYKDPETGEWTYVSVGGSGGGSSIKKFTATIGTSWTEDTTTGVKSQTIPVTGITSDLWAKLEHDTTTIDGTTDGYTAYVEEDRQFLDLITNGYSETYDGGITFHIFGDANTVEIPVFIICF